MKIEVFQFLFPKQKSLLEAGLFKIFNSIRTVS